MILLILIGFVITPYLVSDASALCMMTNEDWPDAPCFAGRRGEDPSLNQMKQGWAPYYEFKGTEWMESQKQELMQVIQNGTLIDWKKGDATGIHNNVYTYYFLMGDVPNEDGLFAKEYYGVRLLSPLQQSESGVAFGDIHCGIDLVLVQKYDGLPACVKDSTKQKLIERGWIMTDDFDHAAMLERGNVAMGFDQNKIHHHFMSTMTGGQIMIMSKNMSDVQTINEIKDHIKSIQYEFSQGNFTNPFYIHAQDVPGTDIMTIKRNLIQYTIQDIDGGSSLILTTNDTELLNAIQQFMDFQSNQHMGH